MKMRTGFHAPSMLSAVAGAAMLAMSATTLAEDTGTGYWTYGGLFAMWPNGRPNHDEYLRAEHEKVMEGLSRAAATEGSAELAAFEVTEVSSGTTPMGFRPWDTHR